MAAPRRLASAAGFSGCRDRTAVACRVAACAGALCSHPLPESVQPTARSRCEDLCAPGVRTIHRWARAGWSFTGPKSGQPTCWPTTRSLNDCWRKHWTPSRASTSAANTARQQPTRAPLKGELGNGSSASHGGQGLARCAVPAQTREPPDALLPRPARDPQGHPYGQAIAATSDSAADCRFHLMRTDQPCVRPAPHRCLPRRLLLSMSCDARRLARSGRLRRAARRRWHPAGGSRG